MKEGNRCRFTTALLALAAAACLGCTQAEGGVSAPSRTKNRSLMTVEDVVKLAKAGVSEEVILTQIRAKHASFDLSADQLIQLKSGSVSERIIRVMMESPAPPKALAQTAAPSAALGARATGPSNKPKSESFAPAQAAVTEPGAGPRQAVSSPAPARWIVHEDPMGFAVSIPAGWELHADRQVGRISIQSPQGQQAVIWPMFIPHQQLDASGAESLVQQLAHRVDATLSWGAPSLTGNTARVFARGQTSGAALMRWSSSPEGTIIYLVCVTAPSALYPVSEDTFAGILRTFHIIAEPNTNSRKPLKDVPAAQVSWVQWNDPREGAFSASVPQGWDVSGGAFRQSATDIRKSLVLLSPDRQIRIAVGDANIGAYAVPNPTYTRFGIREGSSMSVGDGSKLQIRRFLTAPQFLGEYLATSVKRDCGDVRVLSQDERPDLEDSAAQGARAQGAQNPRASAAGVSFSCTWNGGEGRGYYAAATVLPFPGRGGIWYVETLYGYLASVERQPQADDISRRVLKSMGINAQWKQHEDQVAGEAVREDTARAQEYQARSMQQIAEEEQKTSDMMVKGYQARSQAYDEVQRRRENAILGTVDVVDPSSGKQYKIENYSDYQWMNDQGVIAGTKTETSPGYDWREMVTLP